MKKLFTFGKRKKRGLSPNTSDTGSTLSAAGYELKDKDLGKLHRAASSGDVAKIRQLLKKQDINQLDKENRTPLHLACANGYADAVTLLVERKSKLNLCDNDNRSPLMKAIQCQQECCATILLEHDADPNLVDINGNTALHLAALIPSLSIATQLLEHEADINAVNQEGCTPFILAVTENHQEMVAFLLQNEANVNAKDKNRRTPLMIAASNGQITLLKMLLEHDADISIKDVKGWTADDHAVMNGHHACSHLIIEHGSRKKSNASSPYYGTSKTRGASMFSSPDRMVGSGFTLGSPATDKEELQQTPKQTSRARDSGKVTEDISQAESESCTSEKSGEVHSWPSSNEEDLDFSPKKTPKPSLAQLFHTKKNVGGSIKDENSNPRIHLGKSKQGVIANKPCSKLGIEDNVSGAICQEEENEVDNEEDGLQESEDKDEEGEDGVGEDKESEEDDDDDDDYDDEGGREDQESVSENEVSETHISEDEECEDLAENALTCLHDKSVDAQSIKQNVASKKIEIADDKLNAHVADKLLMDTSGIQDSFKSIQTTEAIPDCNDIPVSLIVGFYENVTSLIEGEVVLETYDQTDNHSDDIKEIPKDDKPINDESAIYISAQQDIDLDNNKNNTENYLQREKDETENLSGFIAEQDEEESSSDEADGKDGSYIEEDVERSPVRADLPFPGLTGLNNAEEKLQSVGRKTAALMSELGLEDDESPWDSESASESPGKQSASPLPSPAVQTHMQCISEESNDEFSEKNRALGLDKPKVVQDISKIKDNSSILPLAKGSEGKAKPDVMADLGLDDADDIEDASDWDSTSHSLKCITHNQRTVGHLPPQTSEGRPLHTYSGTAALDTTNTPHITLQTVVELEAENYLHALKRDSVLGSSEKSLQKTQDSEDESSWESKENVHTPNSGENEKFPCAESPNLSVLKVKHDTEVDDNQKEKEQRRKMATKQLIGNDDLKSLQNIQTISDLVTKENVPSKAKSRIGPLKEKNAVFAEEHMKPRIKKKSSSRQAGDKLFHKPQITSVNGDPLEVFDDSTLSETSQEDNGRTPSKCANEKDKIDNGDDLDDFTQSSDTATEDCDSPTSTFRNAMLLIEQLSVEGQDSVNLLKIQNIIHEYERGIQRDNGRYTLLLGKVKKLENERKDLLQIIEKNRELKSILEHQKVEWGSDFNNLRFTLRQEEEKRKSAEMLYDKSRDQLRKKEDQCCKEMEEKQQHERTLRNLELELRSLRNSFKQVEDERNEAQRLLSQENHARALQESILNNLRRKNEELESKNILTKSAEVLSATSELSEREKDLLHRNATLQEEITVFKLELEQVRSRNNEEESRYMEENEMFKEKIDDLRRDLKMNEETLTQTVIQYNGQLNALKTESTMLCSKLEHEKQSKERLETETESIRSRLTSTLQELERNQTLKTDIERNLQRERDEWLRSQDKLSHDLSNIRENNNNLSQQLSRAEAKSNSLENELHRTILTLQEKTILLESTQRDLTQAQCRTKELERTIQLEKDQINKCTVKQESMQERLAQIQSENMLLRQQLEDVQNKGIIKEKAVTDVQDRFTDIFSKLRTDAERQVLMVEERNKDLINKSNELREQLYKLETEKVERESTLRQLQQELADALKKLSMSEASLEVITRYRNDLEEDKLHLQKELEKIKNKLQDLEEQFIQSERRNHQLKSSLDAKEREIFATSQKLQQFSTATAGAETSVKQLEEHVQKLEIENARIEAAAKQQAGRIEILQKELQESLLNRNRLEDLITTLQSSKIGLEEKLNQQVHKQSALSQSAHDSHNLWEEELKSRSRLGVRLAELDREKADLSDQVETERKKVKKLVELKRSMEARFDQEMKRNNELQREITGLKKLLKTAKKKLKECEGGELQQSSFQEGSKNKHLETESKAIRLKEKIEELSLHSERESAKYTQLESTNRDLQEQLSSMKILHKNHERLERINRQLGDEVGDLKKHVESNKVDQSLMEQYKREIEERGRQELRQKLEEVNLFLQTQAASQETLEQIRATNDASARNQLEHRIQDLESELGIIKNTQQDSMCQKETTQTELGRFKDLYMEELKLRKSLAAKLDRSHERLAEANAKLLNERQRSKSLIASSIVNGSLSASPVLDASQLGIIGSNLELNRSFGLGGSFLNSVGNGISPNRVESYLAKMQRELEKNISKELDQANAELETVSTRVSPVGSTAGSLGNLNKDQDPVSRATQQYLEVLKKNYKI